MKLLQTILMLPLISCAAAPGPLGEQTLDITDFDFSTPITTIFPDSYKSKTWGDRWYEIPQTAYYDTNLFVRDSIRSWDTDELLRVDYRQQGLNSQDEYLSFEGQIFHTANFMTTLEGHIMLVCGYAYEISPKASNALIERLTRKYGEPERRPKSTIYAYDLYNWILEDRTIRYAAVHTDESNVMKLEAEHNEQGELTGIREGERKPHLKGYIFVIDAPYVETVLTARAKGDFNYRN